MIPFLVADRPASLRILSDLPVSRGVRVGLMTHANTSDNFVRSFRSFPCGEPAYCEKVRPENSHDSGRCPAGIRYARCFVKMADSGVFTKDGCQFSDYRPLFDRYAELGARYGIMIDYLKDP